MKDSINNISNTNSMYVTSCARAARKSFSRYITPSVSMKENKLFLFIFVFVIYIATPSIQLNTIVDIYMPVIPPCFVCKVYSYII